MCGLLLFVCSGVCVHVAWLCGLLCEVWYELVRVCVCVLGGGVVMVWTVRVCVWGGGMVWTGLYGVAWSGVLLEVMRCDLRSVL